MKRCSRCGALKPRADFWQRARSLDGLQAWCKPCMREADIARRAANPLATKGRAGDYYMRTRDVQLAAASARTKHNMTPPEKRARLDAIGWACEVCGRPFAAPRDAHVDHDHRCCAGPSSCGQCVRGFLCGQCNRALGLLQDDPARIRAAATYLERTTS